MKNLRTKSQRNDRIRDKFLELALVGVLWILLWIPMIYFVTKYGGHVVTDAEYYTIAEMASRPSGEPPITEEEAVLINRMASAPLEQ